MANTALAKTLGLPKNPEEFGPALAHVIVVESGNDILLGQAWLAGPNTLVTCGHVVEQFAHSPAALVVKFPASGNRYVVRDVRLHPRFQRQPDQLVRFDAAVVTIELRVPETDAQPLPFQFDKGLQTHQSLSAIRYPVHLGQFSAVTNPLAQLGTLLGTLRRDDDYHLLHDLALAPGDSGSPIFDGESVVAIHCGDTATLPGLNLPTTSIRMALWIDALTELDLQETYKHRGGAAIQSFAVTIVAFALSFFLAFAAVGLTVALPKQESWKVGKPTLSWVDVLYNKRIDAYQFQEQFSFDILPHVDCRVYVVYEDESVTALVFPPLSKGNIQSERLASNSQRTIDGFGNHAFVVDNTKGKLHFFVLTADDETAVLRPEDLDTKNPLPVLLLKTKDLIARISNDPKAMHSVIDTPYSLLPGQLSFNAPDTHKFKLNDPYSLWIQANKDTELFLAYSEGGKWTLRFPTVESPVFKAGQTRMLNGTVSTAAGKFFLFCLDTRVPTPPDDEEEDQEVKSIRKALEAKLNKKLVFADSKATPTAH